MSDSNNELSWANQLEKNAESVWMHQVEFDGVREEIEDCYGDLIVFFDLGLDEITSMSISVQSAKSDNGRMSYTITEAEEIILDMIANKLPNDQEEAFYEIFNVVS